MKTEHIINMKATKIMSLQALRAIAFLGIFTSHCGVTALGAWGVNFYHFIRFCNVFNIQRKKFAQQLSRCFIIFYKEG